MAPPRKRAATLQPRKIVGLSLAPDVASAFKSEAAKRGLNVKSLFLEMWDAYKMKNKLK